MSVCCSGECDNAVLIGSRGLRTGDCLEGDMIERSALNDLARCGG